MTAFISPFLHKMLIKSSLRLSAGDCSNIFSLWVTVSEASAKATVLKAWRMEDVLSTKKGERHQKGLSNKSIKHINRVARLPGKDIFK